MTQSQSKPPSSDAPHPGLWSRRNLTLMLAVVLSLPPLGGLVELYVFNLSRQDGRSFWSGLSWTVQWVAISIGFVLFVGPIFFPKVRTRLEIPDRLGDERERMIDSKATGFAYTVALGMLLVGGIAAILIAGTSKTIEIPAMVPFWSVFGIFFAYYGAMIYYGKKL